MTAARSYATGMDLRLVRVAARVSQTELAQELGVARSLVTFWEGQTRPTLAACRRFLEALDAIASRAEARRAPAKVAR